jgi:hypothetical protein
MGVTSPTQTQTHSRIALCRSLLASASSGVAVMTSIWLSAALIEVRARV